MYLRGQIPFQMAMSIRNPTPATATVSNHCKIGFSTCIIWLIEYDPQVMIAGKQRKMIPIASHQFVALNISFYRPPYV